MKISLTGKKILVTGATGAIGGAVAEAASQAGALVYGTHFRDESEARRLTGAGMRMFQADLTNRQQVRSLIGNLLGLAGFFDALVYAAGNTRDHTLAKLTDDEWDDVLKLHLEGLVFCSQALLPSMRGKKFGKIVAMGSLSGALGRLGQPNYAAAKAGVIGFMKSLAREAGRFGVTANVVCPGFVDSKMTRSAGPEARERARSDSVLGTISSAQTVASFMVWLLSDLSQGVTGQVFHLDSRIH